MADPYADATTFAFGDTPQMADALLALVLAGTKTATCGALRDFPEGCAARPQDWQKEQEPDSATVPPSFFQPH